MSTLRLEPILLDGIPAITEVLFHRLQGVWKYSTCSRTSRDCANGSGCAHVPALPKDDIVHEFAKNTKYIKSTVEWHIFGVAVDTHY